MGIKAPELARHLEGFRESEPMSNSTILTDWVHVGDPFTATESLVMSYVDASDCMCLIDGWGSYSMSKGGR